MVNVSRDTETMKEPKENDSYKKHSNRNKECLKRAHQYTGHG